MVEYILGLIILLLLAYIFYKEYTTTVLLSDLHLKLISKSATEYADAKGIQEEEEEEVEEVVENMAIEDVPFDKLRTAKDRL